MEAIASKMVNRNTGEITLRGVGADRLWQAYAAGLVRDDLKHDVEIVTRENKKLQNALTIERRVGKARLDSLNQYRTEWLNGMCGVLNAKKLLKDTWIGAMSVGFVLGATAMFFIALAII